MTVRLSQRLQWLADRVTSEAKVADVGTDHALLPVYLVQVKGVSFAVATDVAHGPYTAALTNVRHYDAESAISVRLGDGLATVRPGEVDTVIIAGMGGGTAVEILHAAPDVLAHVQRLLLQPMNATGRVRQWLRQSGFGLFEEQVVFEEGRFYELLAADRQTPVLAAYQPFSASEPFLTMAEEFGPLLLQTDDSTTAAYFTEILGQLKSRHQQMGKSMSPETMERRQHVEQQMAFLTEWVKAFHGEVKR